jgi:hypothetical protein
LSVSIFDAFFARQATIARMRAFLFVETPHKHNAKDKNHRPQATPPDQGRL